MLTSLTSIVMLKSLKSWRWIQTRYIQHYRRKTCMIVSDQQWNRSGTLCEVETVRMNFQPTEQQMSSLVLATLNIKSTIDEKLGYSKKNSAAQKWFIFVAKHIAVMTQNQTKSNLAAKAWIKERLETVEVAPCPNIAKFWKRLLM